MNVGVPIVVAGIVVSIAFSAWRKYSFSLLAGVTCVFSSLVMIVAAPSTYIGQFGFASTDLTDPGRAYTILTSMYTHSGLLHLFFNVAVLMLIGPSFEQRIGTRPFIVLYLLSGLAGTLAFAAFYWGSNGIVVGASGAISGVLGGYARLYPRERLSITFIPMVPLTVMEFVIAFVFLQLVFVVFVPNISAVSHIAGLLVGMLLAPLVGKVHAEREVKRTLSAAGLSKLAITPELKGILERIRSEEVVDVRQAWIDHFLSRAKCPVCGARVADVRGSVMCEKGHLL
ncbi:MAG: rhomboid family intramembrane serine protease [Methanomassiliicoccales archaeon]|nr:rhomboid family intramembrane serine protease [Methanomassiliicoccales archaeon]